MNLLKIFKALANKSRLEILQYLKDPKQHFDSSPMNSIKDGVCVGLIHKKMDLSQSTVSNYLGILEDAGLIQSKRFGQWTHYKRNESALKELSKLIKEQL